MAEQNPNFESIKRMNIYGEEYWSARELAPLLGYVKWERFAGAIKRAMTACEKTGIRVEQHFPRAGKTSPMPHGGVKEVETGRRAVSCTWSNSTLLASVILVLL